MLVKCKTEGCKNYDILIERNLDVFGGYAPGYHAICPECGKERIQDDADNITNEAFNIDHTNLNSKRMFETKVRKYSY